MPHIFCVANQKGGVAKTTTAINLAAGLAKLNQRILLIDLDPQGNATMGSGVQKMDQTSTVYQLLIGKVDAQQAIIKRENNCYDIIPANRELAGAEIELVDINEREWCLRKALESEKNKYDFILIDCPPALSLLTLNGLCAATGVIVPMQCEYFALEGLSDLINTVKQTKLRLNQNLSEIGLLRVMYDPRITLQQQVSNQIKTHFGNKVFDTVIPRNVRLAEAPSYGQPGVTFDSNARGAKAYLQFAKELLMRFNPLSN